VKRTLYFLALSALASPIASAAQQAQPALQQQFDAASDALSAGHWEDALRGFEALELRLTSNRRTLAVVRVRKATALVRLDRREEAAAALRQGLADLPRDDSSLSDDRFVGLLTLAEIAEVALDYPEARRLYLEANAVPVAVPQRLAAYRGLIQTEMFYDAPAALAHADEALRLAQGGTTEDQQLGLLRTLRGRVLLNMGRIAEARSELRAATNRLGGSLTTRVDLADIVARSDRAIAAMLDGAGEDARQYLTYSGAGHHESSFEPGAGRMVPPPCGNGIDPGDVAVVEFSIRDDGSVGHAAPVYSSRQGAAATTLAQAALGWAWDPETFRAVPALFRAALRVELRCSRREPDDSDFLRDDIAEAAQWSRAHGIESRLDNVTGPLESPTRLRRTLTQLETDAGHQSPRLLPVLIALARHPSVGAAETAGHLRQALPIAIAEHAPPTILAAILMHIESSERRATGRRAWDDLPDYTSTLSHPAIRDNLRAASAVRIARARQLFNTRHDREAADLASEVLATPGLAPDDPAVVDATRLRAALAAARGNMEEARAAYGAAGSEESCAIPSRTRPARTSRSDFPRGALRWNFEGWAAVEGRVQPDGRISETRTVISYPPFVFDESAEEVVGRMQLETIDSGACGHFQTVVRYRIAS
jgi:hypothetical protein